MSNILKNGWPIPRFDLALGITDIQWLIGEISNARDSEIEKFENKFAEFLGVKKAIYMNSARGALYLILQCLNLAPHSKVIIPAWTHHSIPSVIIAAGLQPHLVDIREGSWVMGPETISDEDWEGVSAVIITHMYGCPAPVEELTAIARSKNIVVIEDCAQGFGASVNGKKVGTFGDAAIFSFALTKNFTTLGGGMAVFQNPHLAEVASLRMEDSYITPSSSIYPKIFKAAAMWAGTTTLGFTLSAYVFLSVGWSFLGKDTLHSMFEDSINTNAPDISAKPSPVQAALGRRLLEWADEQNKQRTQNGKKLIELFQQAKLPGLVIPKYPSYGESVFTSFVVGHIENEKLARQLSSHSVDTSPGYLKPVQQIPMFSESVSYTSKLTTSNLLARTQLHLPIYPRLKDEDLERIVKGCRYSLDTILHYGGNKEFNLPVVKEEKPHDVLYHGSDPLAADYSPKRIKPEKTSHYLGADESLSTRRSSAESQAVEPDASSNLQSDRPSTSTFSAHSSPVQQSFAPPSNNLAASTVTSLTDKQSAAVPPKHPAAPPLPPSALGKSAAIPPSRPAATPLPPSAAGKSATVPPSRPTAPPLPPSATGRSTPPQLNRPTAPPLPPSASGRLATLPNSGAGRPVTPTSSGTDRLSAAPTHSRPVASSVAKNILALRKSPTFSGSAGAETANKAHTSASDGSDNRAK
ncbi:MAG: aminotransferase class I/II-fold pyridoxal phosphate-dependent enzyme [Candidatus Bruticola sp.]